MKKITGIIACLCFTLCISGCSWQMPEKVSVKTDAEYNFSLGNFEKDLKSEVSMESLIGDLSNPKVTLYDYYPGKTGKDIQHFLIEVKVVDLNLAQVSAVSTALASIPADGSITFGTNTGEIDLSSIPGLTGVEGLDFNPTIVISGLSDAFGSDMIGKIKYASVPMYVYCEAISGLSANATVKMYYGDNENPINLNAATETSVLNNSTITNTPRPSYEKDENIIITDFERKSNFAKVDITSLANAQLNPALNISEDDQLCFSYELSNIAGTISKASLPQDENGDPVIRISLYALIDLPLQFDVIRELAIGLNEVAGATGNDIDTSTATQDVDTSGADDFAKFIDIIENITVRYACYKLPFHASSGLNIGVDMAGKGHYVYAKLIMVREGNADKNEIVMDAATIQKIKEIHSMSPKFQVQMKKDCKFSIPREKEVKVNLEAGIKTNGTVQLK